MPDPKIPAGGSLSLLSIGWRGLEAWREARGTDWQDARRQEYEALNVTPDGDAEVPEDHADLEMVVVTGLPRSGTSMVMQMLRAGGVRPFTDGARDADANNPRGYFEHDRVRALPHDTGWLADADGLAVKVVAPLATMLPAGPQYHVIWVERDLDEVIRSQATMLEREDRPVVDEATLREVYSQHLGRTGAWTRDAPRARGLKLRHAAVLADPVAAAERVAAFLDGAGVLAGRSFDVAAAAAAVDPSLYRTH